jgi:hypothetical protein
MAFRVTDDVHGTCRYDTVVRCFDFDLAISLSVQENFP